MELLVRYLERTDHRVYALVRGRDQAEADSRLRDTLGSLLPDAERFRERAVAVPGDICAAGLGLDRARREALAGDVTEIVHSAASVSFMLGLEESRRINVDGTRRMLELARECPRLRRFGYISTAYVAGTHAGAFSEDQLDVGQDFRNAYERTKFEAEQLVHSERDRLPVQIFRPSIIVGERSTGWTASFNVLYAPLRAFARGALPAVPARRSAPVDVVPVDYVADAVFELCRRPPAEGEAPVYHLVAGPRATTVERLVRLAAHQLRRRPPLVLPSALYRRLLHPLLLRRSDARRRRALEQMEAFFPYFTMRVRFDDRRARARLEPLGIAAPRLERYFDRLVAFARRARWGRAAPTRAEVHRRR
jgi:thioester reductase-like protein